MRHYSIYLIEEEFASHYFGRESKIFHLFQEYHWTSTNNKQYETITKQIEYITKSIPVFYIHHLVGMFLQSRKGYQRVEQVHKIVLDNNRGNATLIVKERYLELTSDGQVEAETIFFEILRKFDPCFLAMDFHAERYGWLNPIKERNFV
ncbi:sporulation inhibitor of replication protein SirA [Metabacillus arenae]|uniref:sporulation inhibitor of replication protein SirA n=1 Tax=Metabacillus arenae TaxID=2771434 RepID=UPI001CD07537|nr:sporulation inhibitor of replication protein SirA [Metabacillus arenae]